jgi:hypothetical protein
LAGIGLDFLFGNVTAVKFRQSFMTTDPFTALISA